MSVLISPSTVIRLDSDVSNSTTSFADVTGLTFQTVPNADYLVEGFLVYTSAATTTGISLGINGPASPAGVIGEWQTYTNDTTIVNRQFRAYNTSPAASAGVVSTAVQYAQYTTMLRTGAAGGAATLRFASEVATSAITIRAGSIIRVQQLAPVSTVNTIERFYAVVQLCQNLSTMQNNMRKNAQFYQTESQTPGRPMFQNYPLLQQAVRDDGLGFLQRLDMNAASVTPHVTEVTDGAAALGILFADMTNRYNLLRTEATSLNTATITDQTTLDAVVTSVLANIPASMLPF